MTTATKSAAKTEAKQAAKGKEIKFKSKTYATHTTKGISDTLARSNC